MKRLFLLGMLIVVFLTAGCQAFANAPVQSQTKTVNVLIAVEHICYYWDEGDVTSGHNVYPTPATYHLIKTQAEYEAFDALAGCPNTAEINGKRMEFAGSEKNTIERAVTVTFP